MGANTKIEWTDHTLNFWWGCQKVSPGCQHCYAETFSKRVGRDIWGPPQTTERWRTKSPWVDCLKWDRQAKVEGVRRKVFCQSMADFFEDHPQVELWRKEAMTILEGFEWLDVQLLTKRPENILRMADRWLEQWPGHIWIGTSVENQEQADKRIPELLRVPAAIRFLSCEPLLGPVDLKDYLRLGVEQHLSWLPWPVDLNDYLRLGVEQHLSWLPCEESPIHWVIVGGESGLKARPMHPNWARSLRTQCLALGTPFYFKQWGELLPIGQEDSYDSGWANKEYPVVDAYNFTFYRVGKHAAGRLLDGETWSQFPATEPA